MMLIHVALSGPSLGWETGVAGLRIVVGEARHRVTRPSLAVCTSHRIETGGSRFPGHLGLGSQTLFQETMKEKGESVGWCWLLRSGGRTSGGLTRFFPVCFS